MSFSQIIATGTYVGNSTSQSISLGWQPGAIVIAEERTSGPTSARAITFKFPGQPGDDFVEISTSSSETTVNGITITSDGFDVGSDDVINDNTFTYHYFAIRDGPWLDTGTYTGNGTSTTVTLNRQPSFIMLMGLGGATFRVMMKSVDDPGLWWFSNAPTHQAGGLDIISTGFTADDSSITNEDTVVYNYCALYDIVGSDSHFETGTWTGDGAATQTMTTGRQPRMVLAYGVTGTSDELAHKTDTMPADEYGEASGAYVYVTSDGTTITSTGFTIGTDQNGSGNDYFYLAGYH